ncbi:hypothetical protein IC229_00880 [Spirosoma sp. BT702]|uniref:SD-repeat containing protein B domain-containing protein n=1 Tax=Spirosoma profusum TaxID=2771354 RepID=A0A926XZI5_9BACT|nr:hypothetical protein [Spirosoma profusum]MBD2699170.1 hypothetical protein [Spirosoma profusum]
MKKGLFNVLQFLMALIGWGGYEVVAQNRIDVTIKYNTTTTLYEVYGRPNFTDPAFGVGAGTQISIVLPASVADNALTVTSVNGGAWSDASRVYAPAADPSNDFHGIATAGNYVSLVSGQEILFFTFGVTGVCLPGIRLFENLTDPSSSAPGFSGGDYKNYIGDALNFGDDVYQSNYYAPGGLCALPPTIAITTPPNGTTTTNTTPVVSGTATPLSSVTAGEGGNILCTTTADASGNWSCSGNTFPTGPHTVTAVTSNAAGVSPTATTNFTVVTGTTSLTGGPGSVFNDLNGNCVADAGETLTGLPATLFAKVINTASPTVAQQAVAVAPNGSFAFTGLANGTYTVIIDDNSLTTDVTPLAGYQNASRGPWVANNGVVTAPTPSQFCLQSNCPPFTLPTLSK